MIEALSSWLVVLDGSGSSLDSSRNSARSFSRRILAASLHFSFIFRTTILVPEGDKTSASTQLSNSLPTALA